MSAIFLSHSSADNEATDCLRHWLEGQGYRSFFLDFDPAQGIPAGRDWEKELYAQLRACRAIIVLCSPHSMASTWCFAEISHARALGKAIFPVKIAACPIHSLLATLQVLDLTAEKTDSLIRLANGLKAAGLDPTDSFDWDGSRPPYPGLFAFDEPDSAVFFGRENEIRNGLDTLSQQRSFGGARFLLVLGASGSGKSSLLRAGIIPRLRRNPEQWIIVPPFRPLGRPFESLASAMSEIFEQSGERREWKELQGLVSDRTGEPLAALVRELPSRMHRPEAAVLLCIDQLEELFTLSPREQAERFLGTVRAAAEARASPLLIAATLRSDFLGAVQSQASLREASFAQLLVNPMAIGRIGQIIEGPSAVANLDLEPGLVPAMLRDTEPESTLPLLAFTLRELWEHRRGDRLTVEVYRDQLGGLGGSVAKAAEGVLAGADAMSSLQESQLRQAFLSLVRVNEEGRFTRRPANWDDLPEPVQPLLERFVQARLLISRRDGDVRTLEVAHEALFRAWGRLATWLDQDRAFLLWRKRLDQALEFWTEGGKSQGRLLTGALLHESEAQLKEHGDPLSKDERALIGASVAANRRARRVIAFKIFGIAVAQLSLMAAAALLSMRMMRTVDGQLAIIDQNYFPAYVALAQANIRSVEESAFVHRSLLAIERRDDAAKLDQLRQQVASTGKTSDQQIAGARQYINRQIADPLDFDDTIVLARLDEKIEALQEERQRYEGVLGKLLVAAEAGDKPQTGELLGELDEWQDDFGHKIDAARNEMRRLAGAAIVGTRAYLRRVVAIGIAVLAIAAVLGLIVAAAASATPKASRSANRSPSTLPLRPSDTRRAGSQLLHFKQKRFKRMA